MIVLCECHLHILHLSLHSLIIAPTYSVVTSTLEKLVDWHTLGVKLGIEKFRLDAIKIDYAQWGVFRQRDEMVNVWLCSDTEASWERLCSALENMNERSMAAQIRSRYC